MDMNLLEFFNPREGLFLLSLILGTWWIWLPYLLWKVVEQFYIDYMIGSYKRKNWDCDLLEILLEKGEEKTPRDMEKVITTLHGGKTGWGWWDKEVLKRPQDQFCLEIVSIDGNIHFLIRTLKKYRRMVESAVYGAFPDVDIIEVDDYTRQIDRSRLGIDYDVFGTDFKLTKPDAYPIRTYYEFLDPDADGKINDPLTQVLEVMSNLHKGEQMWVQIPIEPLDDSSWIDKSKKELEKLLGRSTEDNRNWIEKHIYPIIEVVTLGIFKAPPAPATKEQKFGVDQNLTPGAREAVKAIERNMTKPSFKVSLRLVYIAETAQFSAAPSKSFIGSLKQFNDNTLNGFTVYEPSITLVENFFGQPKPNQERLRKNLILDYATGRKMKEARFVLNTEELATIFHFPGGAVTTSTLRRVKSRTASAPTELPLIEQ